MDANNDTPAATPASEAAAEPLGVDPPDTEAHEADVKTQDEGGDETNKLHVTGVEKYSTKKSLEKEFKKAGVANVISMRKAPNTLWAVVGFADVPSRDAAIPVINAMILEGHKLRAAVHTPVRWDVRNDNKRDADAAGFSDDRGVNEEAPVGLLKDINDVVTPLRHTPYAEQLVLKQQAMERDCVLKAARRLQKLFVKRQKELKAPQGKSVDVGGDADARAARAEMPAWLASRSKDEPAFPVAPIRASPLQEAYRNKCDFTVGHDAKGQPAVGFCLGREKNGSVVIARPGDCVHVPECMKSLCAAFETFVATSPLQPYCQGPHTGAWRGFMVRRSDRTNQTMAVVLAAVAKAAPAEWAAERARLVEVLGPLCTSLFLQEYEGVSAPGADDPSELLAGQDHIAEELFGLRFRIVPGAFFQTNTPACEVLYRTVLEMAALGPGSTLVDVCCGTGTIGICAAKESEVKAVVGVELSAPAVACAEANAIANGLEGRATFVCARAELVLQGVLDRQVYGGSVVAVVDPPRSGLHRSCLAALRNCAPIQRLVYVSCNPTGSLVADMEVLCGPSSKSLPGKAFVPVLGAPIDLFPSTDHCEMIIAFERSA
jgi:tRNA (uracil-5-)-methyltransferase